MRVHLRIKTTNEVIPFDHQPLLTGTIHKWFGWNEEHGDVSLYSFSQLTGGRVLKVGFKFDQETSFFFSSHNIELIKRIIHGIKSDPSMFNGLTVSDIIIQEAPDLADRTLFKAASPIFIKRWNGEKEDHILFNDPRADNCLKESLLTKMRKAGLEPGVFNIRFDTSYPKAATKKITYNGIQNRANWCPVIIEGDIKVKLFAWNVGLGNSTGIGFGAIK